MSDQIKTMTVTIFMKSGNKLVSDCVRKYTFTPSPTGVAKIELDQAPGPGSTVIMIQSLDVNQIEGMTVVDHNLPPV